MKKSGIIFACVVILVGMVMLPGMAKKNDGATIQDGTIYASTGELITLGYDEFGYNYQAHMFKGRYCDSDRVLGGPYSDVNLIMKWNDAWLSNMDRDYDGKLDRHYGFPSYIGSGAWLTNHQSGRNLDGTKWTYFVKIVAVPANADLIAGIWYADGTEIGPDIWGEFAIIQEVYNDPLTGDHGLYYKSPVRAGLGNWQFARYRIEEEQGVLALLFLFSKSDE